MNIDKEFKNIIAELKTLKNVKASEEFKNRGYQRYGKKEAVSIFVPVIRIAFVLVVLFIILGSSAVIASEESKPGDILYPVKKVIGNLSGHVSPEDNEPPKTFSSTTPSPTLTPIPSTALPTSSSQAPSVILSPVPTVTPTLTPVPQGSAVVQSVQTSVSILGAEVNLDLNNQGSNSAAAPTQVPSASQILDLDVTVIDLPILKIGL